ncbi:unnamed protein product [Closterium sp. Naga37s-1]|nr:unnamed protein product [Closterium sp. Naga37s-1]
MLNARPLYDSFPFLPSPFTSPHPNPHSSLSFRPRNPAPTPSPPPSPSDAILNDPGFLSRALQSHACDGPLVAQLAGNDPAEMVRAGWAVLAHMARAERTGCMGEGAQGEGEKAEETKASGENGRMGRRCELNETRVEAGDAAEAERREGGGGGEAGRVCRGEGGEGGEGVERQGEVWELKEGRLHRGEEGAAATEEQRECNRDDAGYERYGACESCGSASREEEEEEETREKRGGRERSESVKAVATAMSNVGCLAPLLPTAAAAAVSTAAGAGAVARPVGWTVDPKSSRLPQCYFAPPPVTPPPLPSARCEQDLPLVYAMVRAMASQLPIPIFCKIRLMPSLPQTIALCRGLQEAGCSLIALHARMPAGTVKRRVGPADLAAVRAVKQALAIPVLSNGNISSPADVAANLAFTGADGAMSAEGVLHDPKIFSGGISSREERLSVALEYLSLCHQLGSVESGSVTWPGIRLHLEYMLGRRGAGRSVSFAHQGAYRRGWELRAALHAAASLPALRHVLLQALVPPSDASATDAPSDASATDPSSHASVTDGPTHASATHPPSNPTATEP